MKLKQFLEEQGKNAYDYTAKQLKNISYLIRNFNRAEYKNKMRWAYAFQLSKLGIGSALEEQTEIKRQDIENQGYKWGEIRERSPHYQE
jgi:hypothetical protein